MDDVGYELVVQGWSFICKQRWSGHGVECVVLLSGAIPGYTGVIVRAIPGYTGVIVSAIPGYTGVIVRAIPGYTGVIVRAIPGYTGVIVNAYGLVACCSPTNCEIELHN